MVTVTQSRPIGAILLMILMLFQAISALSGGAALLLDPSGDILQLPVSLFEGTPFSDFFWPALILFGFLGVFPVIIAYALWARPTWRLVEPIERRIGEHWAWISAVIVSVALLIWCTVELWMIGYAFLQVLYAVVGLAMLVLALLPAVRRYYAYG